MTDSSQRSAAVTRWTASQLVTDMWVDPDDDPRDSGVDLTDEMSVLAEYLNAYRLTMRMKCADLDADQLACRSVPPSTMSLLGLVRHMAEVERSWFRRVMAGEDAPKLYCTVENPDGDWLDAVPDPAMVEQAWSDWRVEVDFAERYVDATPDLDVRGTMRDGGTVQLREVLVHMIEEYARHSGHADLLRECVDGRVGQ